jgi:hypothetical protein
VWKGISLRLIHYTQRDQIEGREKEYYCSMYVERTSNPIVSTEFFHSLSPPGKSLWAYHFREKGDEKKESGFNL